MDKLQLATVELEIARERLRQARHSFNTALVSSITFTSFSLMGAVLLIGGTVTEGAAISSVSMISSVGCIRLAKDANDRLDKLIDEMRSP
jgi:hypothetical protein